MEKHETGLDALAREVDAGRGDTLMTDALALARAPLRAGDEVRVFRGPFKGATGTVVKVGRKYVTFDVRGQGGAPSDLIDQPIEFVARDEK